MGKVFLIDVAGEYGVKGLIGDGKLLKFNFSGRCLGEFPIPFSNVTLQEVEVISVLVTDNNVELGYNKEANFTKKTSLLGLSEIASKISNLKGMVFVGQREGSESGINYNQYIYTFLKGSIPNNFIL